MLEVSKQKTWIVEDLEKNDSKLQIDAKDPEDAVEKFIEKSNYDWDELLGDEDTLTVSVRSLMNPLIFYKYKIWGEYNVCFKQISLNLN